MNLPSRAEIEMELKWREEHNIESFYAYETALHLTGKYPWWNGRRFTRPISAWAAGQTSKTTRDIVQLALLGPAQRFGTGLIPADALLSTTPKAGIPEAVETIYIKHVSGGRSDITVKSYDQGAESFYGTTKDHIWLDEEAELAIYVHASRARFRRYRASQAA